MRAGSYRAVFEVAIDRLPSYPSESTAVKEVLEKLPFLI